MEREEAVRRLKLLEGQDLRPLADKYGVTVWKNGKLNKGWAGHTLERYLGLPLNSSQSPNFGSWELKLVPLKTLKSGVVVCKETMAITMIDPVHLLATPFDDSHLLAKLRKAVVCARMFISKAEATSNLVRVRTFDLREQAMFDQIKTDYDTVREMIRAQGFDVLSGRMGVLVQPRTKGAGHGTTSRAFYARKRLVSRILGISYP